MSNSIAATVVALLNRTKAKYVESAKHDIMLALSGFPDLSPDAENFVFPDRTHALTFRLKGTIPVFYKGNTYNIPVALYLWDTHPYYAPICYVCPTSNMMLKESKTVDKQGRIYLPYLTDWRFPGYDLSGLLQVMAMCFQESCPVFSKPSGSTRPGCSPATHNVGYTPYPSANPPVMPPYPAPASFYPLPTGTVQPEHLKASVMSAVEHKIRQRLRERLGTVHAELASIRQTHSDLREGQQRLRTIAENLAEEQRRMENVLTVYQDKKMEIDSVLSSASKDKNIEIDQVIDACTPLHKQLLQCYVQDCAIDDAIYFLGQALNRNRLSLSNYLKEVRQLSRKQFNYRATMLKCRAKAKMST